MKPDKRFNTVVTELQSMLQVPFIIFGHSHYPAIVEIKKNAWFLNTGSWGQSRDKNFKLPYLLLRAFKGHRSVKLLDWDQYSDSSINLDN
jgi:predicted phosphodiesterase